jgi:hypothetical protein
MDRATILKHLAVGERHVAQGERHIARQKQIIAELDRDGHDTTRAIELLATFQATQALHIADRDRLRNELATISIETLPVLASAWRQRPVRLI